ncbi:MAG: hypothetical protein BJ554DRAFT_2702 [Olpidium bornovanus]|uniref:Uncharacterized protein n=1 Tax=Olpidium bornovanus TaxID=278681 RepID=A0A8H8A0K0_9FUNG|nr:MAG: hypothetical protein BJ554DRAFT_2702 [Olpidium bornovanus]
MSFGTDTGADDFGDLVSLKRDASARGGARAPRTLAAELKRKRRAEEPASGTPGVAGQPDGQELGRAVGGPSKKSAAPCAAAEPVPRKTQARTAKQERRAAKRSARMAAAAAADAAADDDDDAASAAALPEGSAEEVVPFDYSTATSSLELALSARETSNGAPRAAEASEVLEGGPDEKRGTWRGKGFDPYGSIVIANEVCRFFWPTRCAFLAAFAALSRKARELVRC